MLPACAEGASRTLFCNPSPRVQEGTRYSRVEPGLMIQPEDVAQAALLAFRLSPAAAPVELVLNRLQTPYEK